MEEAKTTIKDEEQNNILDLYQEIEDFKCKLSFLTVVTTRLLSDGEEFGEEVVSGYQLVMFHLEDKVKGIDSMLINLLGEQQSFESAETRIKAGFIKTPDEDVAIVKKYIEHIDKMKMRAEDVLKITSKISKSEKTGTKEGKL